MATIDIRSDRMGQDVVFLVTGGTAHIGAVATAYVSEARTVRMDVIALPGHREGDLAVELATLAAESLNRTVAVLVGIHLERPTKQEIYAVVAQARSKMTEMLRTWRSIERKEERE